MRRHCTSDCPWSVKLQLNTKGYNLRSKCTRDGILILAIAGSENLWWTGLVKKEVDLIKGPAEAVMSSISGRDEDGWDAGGNTDRVLSVEVL